jgi:menaquinone-dependent protoporphyrinogen oxidase
MSATTTALATYASAHGSTRGVAERIAARLEGSGINATCLPVSRVKGVRRFDVVMVGSATHNRAWMPDASWFVRSRADEFADKDVWLFSVGMPGALTPVLRK